MKIKKINVLLISLVLIFGCAKKNEEISEESSDSGDTTNISTCLGTSSGSGPKIGSYTLQEAKYLSQCYLKLKMQFEFKNSSSAQYTILQYSDDSCSGASTSNSICYDPLTVTSTKVASQIYSSDGSLGDNVTSYYTTANNGETHLTIYTESSSIFWTSTIYGNKESYDSSSPNLFWKFTKQ